MIDMAGTVAMALRADATLMTLASDRVFADGPPEGMFDVPVVWVELLNFYPAAPPTLSHDLFTLDAVVLAEGSSTAAEVADRVRSVVHGLSGTTQGSTVVVAVDVTTTLVSQDTTYSPSLARWALSVEVTARETN